MKIIQTFFSLLLVLGLLISCTNLPDNVNQTQGEQWLDNLVCEFPCWQLITPQETSFEDALLLLQGNENIKLDFIGENEISFQVEVISGSINRASDDTVNNIILVLSHTTLGKIVHVLGSPGKINLSLSPFDTRFCNVSLIYPESGTILELFLENISNESSGCRTNINSESQVFRIILIGYDLNNSEYLIGSTKTYYDWKGYGEYR